MSTSSDRPGTPLKQYLLVAAGAIIGGVLGTMLALALSKQGYRAGAAPGGLLGIGAGLVWHRSIAVPILCAIAALVLGVVVEWRQRPFAADEGLLYFFGHLHHLNSGVLLMLVVGAAAGFYAPFRAMQRAPKS